MRGHHIDGDPAPSHGAPCVADGPTTTAPQEWLDRVGRIHAYLLRDLTNRLGRQDAEDVLQEFYIRVLRYRPDLEAEASVRSFIYRILGSVVADHYRRLAVQKRVTAAIERHWEAPVAGRPADSAMYDHLRTLIGDLPPQYATLIERVDVNDEPRSEVAANLGITTNNLAVRLLRARSALRCRASIFPVKLHDQSATVARSHQRAAS